MRRLLCALSIATLGLAGSGSSAIAAAPFALDRGDVDIRLVSPAGGLVPGTIARVMIADGLAKGQPTKVHTLRPDAAGWVHVDFPYDDPYVLARPDQRRFNVEVDIAVPLASGYRTVTAVGFVFDRVARKESSTVPTSGSTLTLPDVKALAQDLLTDDRRADPMDCDQDMAEYACAVVTYPSNMNSVPVVLAHNAGAGYDTNLVLTYDQAGRVETTTAADFGAGIVEVSGSQSVSNEDRTTLTYGGGGVRYGNTNEWAQIHTRWSQTKRYHCYKESWPFYGPPAVCEEDATFWAPVGVTGSSQIVGPDPDGYPLWHDRLCVLDCVGRIADNVCPEEFYDTYTKGHGEQRGREYSAKVNVNGSLLGIDLHASAKYVRGENTSTTQVYAYRALNRDAMKHTLFTNAHTAYDPAQVGGGICPSVNIGEAWTATNYQFAKPTTADGQPVADQVSNTTGNSQPSEQYRKVGRCAYVPDDCRPQTRAVA